VSHKLRVVLTLDFILRNPDREPSDGSVGLCVSTNRASL